MNRIGTAVWAAALGAVCSLAGEENMDETVSERAREAAAAYDKAVELREAGRLEDALAGFQAVLAGARPDADSDCRRIYSGAANNAGNVFFLTLNLGRAEFYFRQAVEWDPENALAWNNLGAAYLRLGRLEDAQVAFERAVRENPFLVMPLNNLGRLLLEAGNLKMAAEYLAAGLRIHPGDPETLFLLARLYRQAGLPGKQEEVWKAIVEASGDTPENRLMLAAHYVREGMTEEAEPVIREMLRQRPGFPEARLLLARWHARRAEWRAAEQLLRDLLTTHAADPAVRQDLAAVLVEQDRMAEAVALAEEGADRFPDGAENWYVLGLCRDRQGDRAGAEKAFRRCVKLKPEYARAWNDLGVLAAARDDADGAHEGYARALAADPYFADARYNLGRFLVMTQRDFERGLVLIAAVAEGNSPRAAQAMKFLDDVILIGQGGDPGWGAKP